MNLYEVYQKAEREYREIEIKEKEAYLEVEDKYYAIYGGKTVETNPKLQKQLEDASDRIYDDLRVSEYWDRWKEAKRAYEASH